MPLFLFISPGDDEIIIEHSIYSEELIIYICYFFFL